MGAKATKRVGKADTSVRSVVTRRKNKRSRLRAKHKLMLLVAMSLLILVVVAAGTVLIARQVHNHHRIVKTTAQAVTTQASYKQALAQASKGDTSGAQETLDSRLSNAKTPSDKIVVYQQKMSVALDAEDYDDAISYGKLAETIKPDTDTEQIMYIAYDAQGDTADAKIWLQKSIDNLDKNGVVYDRTLKEYQNDMAELN